MIIDPAEQGTDLWHKARLGIPTASNFSRILTPGGKLSSSSVLYMNKLLAEWMTGEEDADNISGLPYVAHGYMTQPEAIEFYEASAELDVTPVGLCYLDERKMVGASPDGLVGDDGILEIKCRGGAAHMTFLRSKAVPQDAWPQVQGQLWVTGRSWCDYVSYHPRLPSDVVRVERDEPYIRDLSAAVEEFVSRMEAERSELRSRFPEGVAC